MACWEGENPILAFLIKEHSFSASRGCLHSLSHVTFHLESQLYLFASLLLHFYDFLVCLQLRDDSAFKGSSDSIEPPENSR